MIYKVNIESTSVMGYGALYNLNNLQIIPTNAPNPSYMNLTSTVHQFIRTYVYL
jgi:hypothetical protein